MIFRGWLKFLIPLVRVVFVECILVLFLEINSHLFVPMRGKKKNVGVVLPHAEVELGSTSCTANILDCSCCRHLFLVLRNHS